MTTSESIARCGRPTEMTDDDALAALDRMSCEVAALKARFERLRAARVCSRCRGEVPCPPPLRARLVFTADRLASWIRVLWP